MPHDTVAPLEKPSPTDGSDVSREEARPSDERTTGFSEHPRGRPHLAWVTGASSGIGAALALQLAEVGWRVVASARKAEALQQLSARHPRIHAQPLDVTDLASVREAVAAIERQHGPIDLAVLNAGDYRPMPLDEFDVQLFERLMRVNYMGVVHGLDALRGPMCQRGRGQILITASVAGYRGLPLAAPYGASKAALINMAESLHPEFLARGVRLRVINPGFVKSPLTALNHFTMPGLLEPEEAARAILRGIERKGFEISFPAGFVFVMKRLRNLPYALFFPLIRRVTGR
ncbi:MAG: SDR family NAD(P)-dependent oxidoreductase [Pseudomonadota bacterium]